MLQKLSFYGAFQKGVAYTGFFQAMVLTEGENGAGKHLILNREMKTNQSQILL